jgi:hypothetical protein
MDGDKNLIGLSPLKREVKMWAFSDNAKNKNSNGIRKIKNKSVWCYIMNWKTAVVKKLN